MAKLSSTDLSDKLRLITLSERLDVQGAEKIEQPLTDRVRGAKGVIVDLKDVTFLSSVGIRVLIANAKALKESAGKLVLVVGENAAVSKTIKTTCADALMPMFKSLEEATAALNS